MGGVGEEFSDQALLSRLVDGEVAFQGSQTRAELCEVALEQRGEPVDLLPEARMLGAQ